MLTGPGAQGSRNVFHHLWVLLICGTILAIAGCTPTEYDPMDPEIVQAREQARTTLETELNTALAVDSLEQQPMGLVVRDVCKVGGDTLLSHEIYKYKCMLSITRFASLKPNTTPNQLQSNYLANGWKQLLSGLDSSEVDDPSTNASVCTGRGWFSRGSLDLFVILTTPRQGGTDCWKPDTLTHESFLGDWENRQVDIPTWVDLGSPDAAAAVTISMTYYEIPN